MHEIIIEFIREYGFFALIVISFFSASILPFTTEGAITASLFSGISPQSVVIACSIGNIAACGTNYLIGTFFYDPDKPHKKSMRKAQKLIQKYGGWSLLLSWTPILGDPLTFLSGVFRINFLKFSAIVYPLRILRYIVLVYITAKFVK
jgi:membrane protein YqaA with SNARE-associated domain